MNNYEILKSTKITHNNIDYIINNISEELDENKINELNNIKNILDNLYDIVYQKLQKQNKEQLMTDACCKDCNNNLLISDNIDYSYQCLNCDENYYDFEAITDRVWYEEEKREELNLPSSFYLDVCFDKDEELLYVATENSSGAKYKCNNTKDFIKNMESYCLDYLTYEEEKEVEI